VQKEIAERRRGFQILGRIPEKFFAP